MAYERAIQALADPTRRAVLERLRRGSQPVGKIAEGLHVTRPAVSQHLKVLEGAGLVRVRREGVRRIYSVEVQGLVELRRYLEKFWDDVLEAFRIEAERGLPPAETRDHHGREADTAGRGVRRRGRRATPAKKGRSDGQG